MPQALVQPEDLDQNKFVLRGNEAHHLIRVLRVSPHEEVDLFDGLGHRYRGRITRIDEKELIAEGEVLRELPKRDRFQRLCLFQGLPRGSKFDYVIEKATELGADEIIPFLSEKNPIKLNPAQAESKLGRWKKVGRAAAKQSNRDALPSIARPDKLRTLASSLGNGLTLVLWEKEKQATLKLIFEKQGLAHEKINLVVGPEAGFTEREVAWLKEQGGWPVTLGSLTLRTETAGLAVLSILNYELGLF